jgi:hypothetical protein
MNYVPYSTIDSYYKIKGETHESNNSVENFETNAIDQAELQQFREKERLYHQKSTYQTEETMQIESYKNILTIVFYVLCIPLIYFIYISDSNIYLKAFYVVLALAYPMYISFIEDIIYGTWVYIIAMIRGVPTEKL